MIRQIAANFLRSTAKGPLVEALPQPSPATAWLSRTFRLLGRGFGRFLSIEQEWTINRFRIPVAWQPPALELCLREAIDWLAESSGGDGGEGTGDYLEFGVYQGNSLIAMHRALQASGREGMRLFGFDSFRGLPPEAALEGVWTPGQFRCARTFTQARLSEAGVDLGKVRLIEGFFSASLTPTLAAEQNIRRASIVMIDCDLYSSTREALAFCLPLLGERSVILFDDWHSTPAERGEQRAFGEMLAAEPGLSAEATTPYHNNAAVFRLVRQPATAAS